MPPMTGNLSHRRSAAAESRGGRRDPGLSLAAIAIDAAAVIRRLLDGGVITDADRAAVAAARETMLNVAAAAQVHLPGVDARHRGARASVVQARLTLAALGRSWAAGEQASPAGLEDQLVRLLNVLDELAAGRLPDDAQQALTYFEELAQAALRASSSTGEVLVGGSRR